MSEKHYTLNFKIKWFGNNYPDKFFIDLIISDLLINPMVKKFRQDLKFWAIHRSSDPKIQEHMFEFRIYSTSETKENIHKDIISNNFYTLIKDNYLEKEIYFNDSNDTGSEKIEAVSDADWPLEIKKVWPYYIMGVSDMFIKLIEELRKITTDELRTMKENELENYYKELEQKIDSMWLNYGCHSFIHHLSAVFGYKPIIPQPRWHDPNSGAVIF